MASNENGEASDEKPEPKGIDIALNETGQFDIPEDFVEEEKSVFQKPGNLTMQDAVPVIPKRAAIACFVLNLMCPGLGKFQCHWCFTFPSLPSPKNSLAFEYLLSFEYHSNCGRLVVLILLNSRPIKLLSLIFLAEIDHAVPKI